VVELKGYDCGTPTAEAWGQVPYRRSPQSE
jgi:hypothetical protein